MAVRNQVLSLFGATPEQIMQQERARQAEFLAAQRDPFQSAGAAIGVGLSRLFGGESAEMDQARQMQEAVAGIDPNNPDALRALAQSVSSFAPERALQIAAYASELEKSMMGQTVNVPEVVGYDTKPDVDTLTGLQRVDANGQPMFTREPIFRNVPYERTPQGLRRLEGIPEYIQPQQSPANANANDSQVASQPDFIVDPETNRLVPNPAKSGQAPATQEPFEVQQDPRITAETEQAMASATGPRGGGSMGSITAVPPPPKLEAETTYINPDIIQEEIDVLKSQITGLPANSPQRKRLQSEMNRLRAQKRKFQKGTTRTRGR